MSGSGQNEPLAAHFISEAGIVDAFILLGPTPNEAFKQYTDLTGVAPLPQVYIYIYLIYMQNIKAYHAILI